MQLVDNFVQNPVKVAVGVLLVALFGLVAVARMPMQLTPEVQTPTITVETRWPGASPQEVEQEIVIEQEEQLKSVEGVTKMSSESTDSKGTITLEFLVGTDMKKAVVDVIGRLEQVPDYPEDADKPVISTSNASDRPIAWFILSAERPSDERIAEFQAAHPELTEQIQEVRNAHNPGLAMLRLRLLAEKHAEVKELLPPEDFNVTKLRRFAEDEIEARFERVPGVSQANVIGGLEDELQVIVDPERLAARNLTITDVRDALRAQNADVSAGDMWESKRRWVVRTLGQFRSPEDVGNQLLAVQDGAPVYVHHVADVEMGFKKPDGLVRRFGESSIAINALRETGANVLDVMDGLRSVNAELNEKLLPERGLVLTQVYDETEYIESSVDLVRQNIVVGGALTMIVLMLFLHLGVRTLFVVPLVAASALASVYVSPWFFGVTLAILVGAGFWVARGALVVGLAIPTSIVGTFLILGVLGRSLNVISLAGMAFAVGMLVDNAVVVLENVFRRIQLGERPFVAAANGTREVSGAIVASTLTTIAVFLPIVFVQEEAGQLFRDIALAISGAVALSLVVSMTLIPTASARLFKEQTLARDSTMHGIARRTQSQPRGKLHGFSRKVVGLFERVGSAFVGAVVGLNAWIQKSTVRGVAVVAGLVGVALVGSWLMWPKVEYLPTGNRNLVFGILLPPPGYNLDELMAMGEQVEADLRPYWNVDPGSPEAEKLDYPVIGDFFFVARGRSVFIGIRAHEPERCAELIPLVQQVGSRIPGTFAVAKQSSLFEQGLTAGRTIDIEISGPDLDRLLGLGGQILGGNQQLGTMPVGVVAGLPLPPSDENPEGGVQPAQARPVPSLDKSSPELHLYPKLMQSAEMGISASDLGYTANALVDGAYSGDYLYKGDKIDLTIVGRASSIEHTQDVEALPVATRVGQVVPLGAVARIEYSSGPEQINHRERVRAITIEVSPPPEVPLEDAMLRIRNQIVEPIRDSGQLDGGYRIALAGTADKLSDVWATFAGRWTGWNVESLLSLATSQLVLVVVITYLLMAALFESWLYPFVIILSVPLGAVGGLLGLKLLNWFGILQPLDILTMLGFVILVGTVVNNPILIVHQALNHIREDGMSPAEAVVESVRTRIRPIFMTTATTVLGLLPLVLFPGAGSELYRGLGSVVLGGLVVSTVFTLVLVPTLFRLTMGVHETVAATMHKIRAREPRRPSTDAQPAFPGGVSAEAMSAESPEPGV